jgi:2,4-diketo-3-deoxy-L-fuconate hydrolase
MATWSLVSIESEEGTGARAAVLADGRLRTVPFLDERLDVLDVLCHWTEWAPRLRSWDPATGVSLDGGRMLAPIRSPRKLICAGANYVGHLREMGITELPDDLEPYFFLLPPTTIAGPGDDIVIPGDPDARVDWEAELAVVIGVGGRNITAADALGHVAGYTIVNDVTARGRHARPNPLAPPFTFDWLGSKGLDSFLPLGPGVTPSWLVDDPQALPVRLWRNGELEQDGNTADMIFTVSALIEAASASMTLQPGDVIATGTPAGVGVAQGKALQDGDVVSIEIGSLGTLENTVRVVVPVVVGAS